MLTPAHFPSFFEAVWGDRPFDWQTRLLERVHTDGWPSTLDLPTGSGKTSALDVALFALALDAFVPREKRRQPRRVALVVDRRVVVDQAYERAVALAEALARAKDGVLAQVADALRELQRPRAERSEDAEILPVLPAILRGGMPREAEWARTPHQPVLLVSTVDQVGSRLLFRGYGVSAGMRSVHAGLLGRDTLYLLDEVHLSRPFEETLSAVADLTRSDRVSEQLPRPLVVVRMSATVAERPSDTFALTDADRESPELAARLGARKWAVLRAVKTQKDPVRARAAIAKACVREAERLSATAARVVAVIVNRVDTARRVAALAREKLDPAWDVSLMTGRMRPLDRAELAGRLMGRIRAGRTRTDDRVLLVSTQAIEAGADFDFDALVTECASLDALRQRFGRLDRLGELEGTEAVIVAGSGDVDESAPADPIYGGALRATWSWLNEHAELDAARDGRVIDLGIAGIETRLERLEPRALIPLLAPRSAAPILVPSHVDRWVQTSPAPSADPEISAFLHGPERGAPDVQIVWRADLRPELLDDAGLPAVRDMFGTVPPSALEALTVPLWAARDWLGAVHARAVGAAVEIEPNGIADVEGAAEPTPSPIDAIATAVLWRGDDTALARRAADIRPGATLVVPSSYGGLDDRSRCWDPEAIDPVPDRGDEAQLLHRGRAVVRWSSAVLSSSALPAELAAGPTVTTEQLEEEGAAAEAEAFRSWAAAALAEERTPPWMRFALAVLRDGARRPRLVRVGDGTDAWHATFSVRRVPRAEVSKLSGLPAFSRADYGPDATTEDDASSFTSVRVPLDDHLGGVRDFALRFADALGLPDPLVADVALSGRLHDVGKADTRFQVMLHGGDPVAHALADELLAKSAVPMRDRAARDRARERAGYPKGTRHELMSLAMVEHVEGLRSNAADWELVLHLVASHHGYCRPFAPPALDPVSVPVEMTLDGERLHASSDHRLARVDSGVAERFWLLTRRYGWWGLAWLEAILRLADHRESEQEERSA